MSGHDDTPTAGPQAQAAGPSPSGLRPSVAPEGQGVDYWLPRFSSDLRALVARLKPAGHTEGDPGETCDEDCRLCIHEQVEGCIDSYEELFGEQPPVPGDARPPSPPEGMPSVFAAMPDDAQCNALWAMPCPFNELLRTTFKLGWDRAMHEVTKATQAREARSSAASPPPPPEGQPSEHEIARIARLLYLEQARQNGHDPDDEVWEQDRDAYMADARTAIPLFRRLYAGQA